MKKLHLIIFALFIAVIASAQRPITVKQFPNNANQKESIPTATQVAEVNQRVNALIKDIESLYSQYNGMSDQWFKNEKDIKTKMQKEVKDLQEEQQKSINTANNSIETIKNEMKWIDELRAYYGNGSLDDLYRGDQQHPKADVSTLRLHMQLLGKDYPKKMDDLLEMAECASSINKEYNAALNKEYRNRLGKVAECDTKWDIDGLLAVHGDVKNEIDKWNDRTLPGLMTLRRYLMNEYGVDLDKDFPVLAEQAWKSIIKTGDKQNK